jgi:hypothetical protein
MFKKFNWGHGLFIFITLFMANLLYLVSLCFNTEFDLVSKDYYEKEIAYQEQIERHKNTSALSADVKFALDKSAELLNIELPKEYESESVPLLLYLYKPDDAGLDRKFQLTAEHAQASFQTADLKQGLWHIQLSWEKDGKGYFTESSIYIH